MMYEGFYRHYGPEFLVTGPNLGTIHVYQKTFEKMLADLAVLRLSTKVIFVATPMHYKAQVFSPNEVLVSFRTWESLHPRWNVMVQGEATTVTKVTVKWQVGLYPKLQSVLDGYPILCHFKYISYPSAEYMDYTILPSWMTDHVRDRLHLDDRVRDRLHLDD